MRGPTAVDALLIVFVVANSCVSLNISSTSTASLNHLDKGSSVLEKTSRSNVRSPHSIVGHPTTQIATPKKLVKGSVIRNETPHSMVEPNLDTTSVHNVNDKKEGTFTIKMSNRINSVDPKAVARVNSSRNPPFPAAFLFVTRAMSRTDSTLIVLVALSTVVVVIFGLWGVMSLIPLVNRKGGLDEDLYDSVRSWEDSPLWPDHSRDYGLSDVQRMSTPNGGTPASSLSPISPVTSQDILCPAMVVPDLHQVMLNLKDFTAQTGDVAKSSSWFILNNEGTAVFQVVGDCFIDPDIRLQSSTGQHIASAQLDCRWRGGGVFPKFKEEMRVSILSNKGLLFGSIRMLPDLTTCEVWGNSRGAAILTLKGNFVSKTVEIFSAPPDSQRVGVIWREPSEYAGTYKLRLSSGVDTCLVILASVCMDQAIAAASPVAE